MTPAGDATLPAFLMVALKLNVAGKFPGLVLVQEIAVMIKSGPLEAVPVAVGVAVDVWALTRDTNGKDKSANRPKIRQTAKIRRFIFSPFRKTWGRSTAASPRRANQLFCFEMTKSDGAVVADVPETINLGGQ